MGSRSGIEGIVTLPVEIHFNRRQWRQFRCFLTGMFLVVGFIAGLIGGRSWGEALEFELGREEMLEARAALAQILAAAGRPNLIPDSP